jgi:hypothetical protein
MRSFQGFGAGVVLAVAGATGAQASALVVKDDANQELRVIARIAYSGAALTEGNAADSTREIREMWNESRATVKLGSDTYRVVFEIDHVRDAGNLPNRDSCAFNYIQVRDKVDAGDRSFYEGLGSQSGVFFTSDDLGNSTTAAHEFGHGLMLDHNPYDQRASGVPGIMFARGTLVEGPYQWDPNAASGGPGGTVNPKFRKVRAEDVRAIPFAAVQFGALAGGKLAIGCIGFGQLKTLDGQVPAGTEKPRSSWPGLSRRKLTNRIY